MRGPSLLSVKWGLGGPHPSSLNKDSVAGGEADGAAANQMCCQGRHTGSTVEGEIAASNKRTPKILTDCYTKI